MSPLSVSDRAVGPPAPLCCERELAGLADGLPDGLVADAAGELGSLRRLGLGRPVDESFRFRHGLLAAAGSAPTTNRNGGASPPSLARTCASRWVSSCAQALELV